MKFGIARGTVSPGPYTVAYRRTHGVHPPAAHTISMDSSLASFAMAYGVSGRGASVSRTGALAWEP